MTLAITPSVVNMGEDVVSHHNKLRDIFSDFCQCACLGPRLEMGLSVTSTLHSSVLLEASMTAGLAALAAENRKHNNNDRKCEELGWVCIPLVVETYGCWGAAAVATFSKLASHLSTTQVRNYLWNIQPPRPSLSESQLQSHHLQGNLTVRPEVPLFRFPRS